MISLKEIQGMIQAGLPGSRAEVKDMTGTGDHFEITVVSKSFTGKSLIDQHKAVFAILAPEMESRIHAVKLKTRTE